LWDPTTRQPVDSRIDGATAIAIRSDGQLLATASADGRVRLLPAPTDWIARACERAGRNLTASEWNRYVGQAPYVRHCAQHPPGQGADPDAPTATYRPPLGR
jgi:hypothetical protein